MIARAREDAGWTRRFQADRRRAAEARALYGALGFEVELRPVAPRAPLGACASCAGCHEVACREDVVVYTRSKHDHADHE